ncbi:TPA: TIR domain-containing protein [Citrobacter farmeri]|nr:TIR domain-containing protein [Citrobacter farmeri]HAT2779033.1 TIR domain-containing protein [Citrobacter farmeri]HAT2810039.1 TIR domain-containing protein [Citrobacter farmeri]HBC0549855.1 TIR domain-containing protein [Citrobacter farmeri]
MQPKVFISYSWSSPAHKQYIQQIADRLLSDGVDVIIDIYDLKEGHDKNAFMERMIADVSVTHVLVMCDKLYSEKADARKAGVGTESQIISQEVYSKVEQSKFIPIVCQLNENNEPYLPVFMRSRIWIDLSSDEKTNENWEKLIRLLNGQPLEQKPKLGKKPSYLDDNSPMPTSEALAKLKTLKQAIIQDKKGLRGYRTDFLNSCWEYLDNLRPRVQPESTQRVYLANKIIEDSSAMLSIRNYIVDWVLIESEYANEDAIVEPLISLFEKMLELRSVPSDMQGGWNDAWFEAQHIFVCELFLYVIAALIKNECYNVIHEIYTTSFLDPSLQRQGRNAFVRYTELRGYSELLQDVLAPEGRKLLSPAAELMKRQATREDLPFKDLIQADLLSFMFALSTKDLRWYPQTYHYCSHYEVPSFFLRATRHKYFEKLAVIIGVKSADDLRRAITEGMDRVGVSRWSDFSFNASFWEAMNMDKLNTLD